MERKKALNARYRTFQAELKQLNHFWHGALGALIAEMPAASELKSYQEISAIVRNTLTQLAKYLPDDSEEGLTQLCQWIAAQHFKDMFMRKTLPDLIDNGRALMYSTDPNQALLDPVYDLLHWEWTERACRACLQNPAIRTLGEGDVCAGISSVITSFLLRGQMNAIELANAAPIEQIKIQILAGCIPEILDVADTTIVFDIACTIPDKEKRHTAFSDIATWLVAHGFSESDLFLQILEKLDEESANLFLQFLVKNLLEEGKGEKALLLAPRITLSSESSKEIHAEVWCDLIQFFMDANDPNQAFALVDQLEERNDSKSQWKISELAVMLIKCGEYQKASCLTKKIMQFSDESFSIHHLRIIAEALAKKGKWEEFVDVALQLLTDKKGIVSHISDIIQNVLATCTLEYDQLEKLLFFAGKMDTRSDSAQSFIIISAAKKGQWKEAMALVSKIERDTLREHIIKVLFAIPGCPYSSTDQIEKSEKP